MIKPLFWLLESGDSFIAKENQMRIQTWQHFCFCWDILSKISVQLLHFLLFGLFVTLRFHTELVPKTRGYGRSSTTWPKDQTKQETAFHIQQDCQSKELEAPECGKYYWSELSAINILHFFFILIYHCEFK